LRRFAGDLARVQCAGWDEAFLEPAKACASVRRGSGRPRPGFVAPAFFDQQVNVAVVDIRGVGGEGQPRAFLLELRFRRLEGV